MDELPDPQGDWNLEADKKLFDALQQFSASLLTRLKEAKTAVSCLTKSTEDAEIRANCAQASFRQLANTHYIEQVSSLFSPMSKVFWPTDATKQQLTRYVPWHRPLETRRELCHTPWHFLCLARQCS